MPDDKRGLVDYMIQEHKISKRQACKAISLPLSTGAYRLMMRLSLNN